MKNKNFFQRMAQLIAIFGLSLLIGNISAFIAMNMLPTPKDTLFFLWQRRFIDAMVQLGMIKGMWLFFIGNIGLMDKIQAKKLHKPLFYLPLQAFEKMNKKSAFTVVVK